MAEGTDTTQILIELSNGDHSARERLLPLVYDELRAVAAGFLSAERPGHSLPPTAIANEAYLRLIDQTRTDWRSREQFFAVAARLIRRILVDHARERAALKRGGDHQRCSLDGIPAPTGLSMEGLLALDDALEELDLLNQRHRQVVELRFFGGLSLEQAARVLGVSPHTVKADWAMARAWLRVRLGD